MESGAGEDLSAPATPLKSATSIAIAETENEDVWAGPHSSEKQERTNEEDRLHNDANMGEKTEPGDLDRGKVETVESKSAQVSKRSKKPKHSMKSAEASKSFYSDMDIDKEAKCTTEGVILLNKEFHASPSKDPSTEVDVHKQNEIEIKQLSFEKPWKVSWGMSFPHLQVEVHLMSVILQRVDIQRKKKIQFKKHHLLWKWLI